MKTERNILIAFLLNFFFAIIEFVGGGLTGSVAIMSDAVHDLGDALSIGLSWFLEKKSRKQPDETYTYGYGRLSVLSSIITTMVLLAGSAFMIFGSIQRIIRPTSIDYNGMIGMAIFGVIINFGAAYVTREGDSLNQKAVNLHMLEDVLGWAVVLVGAIVMRFTDFAIIDPCMSIGVSIFILINCLGNLREATEIFMGKIPEGISVAEIKEHLSEIEGVKDVHHIHLWSLDGQVNFATMHVVTNQEAKTVKAAVRKEMEEHGFSHVTIEIEAFDEECGEVHCEINRAENHEHRHGHHHQHGHHLHEHHHDDV